MNERKDERWLDRELRRAIRGDTPRFDAQAWKQKHSEEYQKLVARGVGWGLPHRGRAGRWLRWDKPHPTVLAVAAVVAVAIGLFILNRNTHEQENPLRPTSPVAGSPTEMQSAGVISFESLTLAFRRGGEEALNRQLDTAQETLGPRPDGSLLSDVLNDIRG